MFLRDRLAFLKSDEVVLDGPTRGNQAIPQVFTDLAAASEGWEFMHFDGYGKLDKSGHFVLGKSVIVVGQGMDDVRVADTPVEEVLSIMSPWVEAVADEGNIPANRHVALTARHAELPVGYIPEVGWHVDRVAIVCATDVLPTETAVGSLELAAKDQLIHLVLPNESRDTFVSRRLNNLSHEQDRAATPEGVSIVPLEAGYNYWLGPSVQHRAAANPTDCTVSRNFIRLGY
jgi:hypothetical protein